ncbi:MAG: MFS transporter [Firmicutes bacterium]|nr:MFS transporter [Bacillota bacterium]
MSSSILTLESLVGRMERLPFSGIHKKVFGLSAAGYLFDAYDMALLSFIMPALSKDLNLSAVQTGLVFSVSFLGMLCGALLGGTLSDHLGRLKVFKYTLLIFSFATAITGLVQSYEALLVLRFITGFGLGGEQPVVFTYVSEMVPNQYRGRLNGLTEAMWGFGMLLAAGVTFFIVPVYGWRWAFFAGILPACLIWYFRLGIPESPRWFMIKGQHHDAERQLELIEKEVEKELGKSLPEPKPVDKIHTEKGVKFSVLFRPLYSKRTIMLWLLWFCALFGYWGLNTWLPTLLKQAGYSMYASIGYVFIMNTVWVPSGILGSYLSDRIGRKYPIVFYLVFAGITTLVYGWALTQQLPLGIMLSCGIAAVLFMAGAFAVIYAYTPENYPTEVRGTGTGTANGWGRIGGMIAPTVVGYLYPIIGLYFTLGAVASAFVLAAIVVAMLGTETKGKNLEAISQH